MSQKNGRSSTGNTHVNATKAAKRPIRERAISSMEPRTGSRSELSFSLRYALNYTKRQANVRSCRFLGDVRLRTRRNHDIRPLLRTRKLGLVDLVNRGGVGESRCGLPKACLDC